MHASTQNADACWSPPHVTDEIFWRSSFVNELGGVKHAFAPLGCNMSKTSGSDTDSTIPRRVKACAAIGSSIERLVCAKQAHEQNIAVVGAKDGRRVLEGVDGFATDDPGVTLMAFTADCPTVMVFDPTQKVLGLVHSGWKGSCLNVVAALIATMTETLGANMSAAWATIGPCAGGCCYEIKQDVAEQVEASTVDASTVLRHATNESKFYLNLPMMIAAQLQQWGIAPKQIGLPSQCTICDTRFYSYRRQGPNAGQAALLARIA